MTGDDRKDTTRSNDGRGAETGDGEAREGRTGGQYGGLRGGIGYGGGRKLRDAERPAKDLDFDDDERPQRQPPTTGD